MFDISKFADYPTWVKIAASAWVFLTLLLSITLIFVKPKQDHRKSNATLSMPATENEAKAQPTSGGWQPPEKGTEEYGSTSQLARHFKNAGCNSLIELDPSSALVNFKKSIEYNKNSDFLNWVVSYIEGHNEALLPSQKTEAWLELYRHILTTHEAELDAIIKTRFIEAVDTGSR